MGVSRKQELNVRDILELLIGQTVSYRRPEKDWINDGVVKYVGEDVVIFQFSSGDLYTQLISGIDTVKVPSGGAALVLAKLNDREKSFVSRSV